MLTETKPLQPPGPQREIVFAYAAGLARALAERRDPVTISLLIEYSAFVSHAIDGLAEFGETVVPLLLKTLARPKENPSRTSGVTVALAKILERDNANATTSTRLSSPTRELLLTTARRLLGPDFNVGNLLGTTMLALATGDPELRAQLERLSESGEAWTERGVTASSTITLGQNVIRSRLRMPRGERRRQTV